MYLNLSRELKKLRNMKVILILIETEAIGTIPKVLESRLEELEFIVFPLLGLWKTGIDAFSKGIHKK